MGKLSFMNVLMAVEVFVRYRYNRIMTANGESMTSSPVQQEHIRQHRRETFVYMIVPLMVTVFIVLLGIVIVLLLQRQLQVSLLADWMMTDDVLPRYDLYYSS